MFGQISRSWSEFWFSPRAHRSVAAPRAALCAVAACWFASFLGDLPGWFGREGILTHGLSAQLIEFEQTSRWQNWSPLWLVDSINFARLWLIVGMILSIVAAAGIGGRATMTLLLIWIIAWAHRITWLQGPVEPALVACIAYLIIEPGTRFWPSQTATTQHSWQAGLALRLIQTHWWILVAAGVLSQLGSLIWWRGEGVWWLASAGRSNWLSIDMLRGQASLINAISHGVIVVQGLALWTITLKSTRLIGCMLGIVVSMIYGGVADFVLYGMLLAACLCAFSQQR